MSKIAEQVKELEMMELPEWVLEPQEIQPTYPQRPVMMPGFEQQYPGAHLEPGPSEQQRIQQMAEAMPDNALIRNAGVGIIGGALNIVSLGQRIADALAGGVKLPEPPERDYSLEPQYPGKIPPKGTVEKYKREPEKPDYELVDKETGETTAGYERTVSDFINEFNQQLNAAARLRDQGSVFPEWLNQGMRSGIESLTEVAAMASTGGGFPLIIAEFMASAANRAITEGKQKGLSPEAVRRYATLTGVIEGAVTSAFQAAGLGGLEKLAASRSAISQAINTGLKDAVKQGVKHTFIEEMPEEYSTELLQAIVSKLEGVDPEALTPESILDLIKTTTAATVTSMGLAEGVRIGKQQAIRKAFQKEVDRLFSEAEPKLQQKEPHVIHLEESTVEKMRQRLFDKNYLLGEKGPGMLRIARPNVYRQMMEVENPSRKDFRNWGIPGQWSQAERNQLVQNIRRNEGLSEPSELVPEKPVEAEKVEETPTQPKKRRPSRPQEEVIAIVVDDYATMMRDIYKEVTEDSPGERVPISEMKEILEVSFEDTKGFEELEDLSDEAIDRIFEQALDVAVKEKGLKRDQENIWIEPEEDMGDIDEAFEKKKSEKATEEQKPTEPEVALEPVSQEREYSPETIKYQIYKTYKKLTGGVTHKRVRLYDLRKELPNLSKKQLDDILWDMNIKGEAILYPMEDPMEREPDDDAAALRGKHIIIFDKPYETEFDDILGEVPSVEFTGTPKEPEPEPTQPQKPETKPKHKAEQELVDTYFEQINENEGIDEPTFWKLADEHFGGTRAEGKYGPSDAYDALETALHRYLSETELPDDPIAAAKQIEELLNNVPRQKNRSGEKNELQQFSTPPHYAYAVQWAANIQPNDVVLEPQAGTGSLLTQALQAGATVLANELSPRRANLLRRIPGIQFVFEENAEQIHNILPYELEKWDFQKPSVILMNPPFSRTQRSAMKKGGIDLEHVSASLKLLDDGGRLVAIVGYPLMGEETKRFNNWMRKIRKEYNVRANIPVGRDVYKAYGTTFPTRVLVIDKTGPTQQEPLTQKAEDVPGLIKLLQEVRDGRIPRGDGPKRSTDQPAGQTDVGETGRTPGRDTAVSVPTSGLGTGQTESRSGLQGSPTETSGDEPEGGDEGAGMGGGTGLVPEHKRPGGHGGVSGGESVLEPGGGRGTVDVSNVLGGFNVEEDYDSLFDEVAEESEPETKPKPTPKPPRKKPKQEKKTEKSEFDKVLDRLGEILPASYPRTTSPAQIPGVDPNIYHEAKPVLRQALEMAAAQGMDVRGFLMLLKERFGAERFVRMKPYVKAFILEQQSQTQAQPKEAPPKKEELSESAYEEYIPENVGFEGKPHLGSIVESSSMSSVKMPPLKYKPSLPDSVVQEGRLSAVQLVPVAYAGQAHEQFFKEGGQEYRQGFIIGDGTGLGKTMEGLGVVLDNWLKGRKKAVWLSTSQELMKQLQSDWKFLTKGIIDKADHLVFPQQKLKNQKEGILYTTYTTLQQGYESEEEKKAQKKKSRLDELSEWLGSDFDGVMIFDEAHKMKNTLSDDSTGRKQNPSKSGLVAKEFRRRFPKARVVYMSATAATEVKNYAYADRLGIWGIGRWFPTAKDFINSIAAGGLNAMEMLARDLKALGLMVARRISMNDGTQEGTVTYDRVDHVLSKEQEKAYDDLVDAWRIVRDNFEDGLRETNAPDSEKTKMRKEFGSARQRFFEQVINAMAMPSALDDMQKQLDEGKSIVVQVVNTYEAQQERAIQFVKEQGLSLEDAILSPILDLMNLVHKFFPTVQYETVVSEDGTETKRPVTKIKRDEQGNIIYKKDKDGNFKLDSKGEKIPERENVKNPEMVKARDELIERLKKYSAPASPIDMIIERFGSDMVAEISGRKRRVVTDPETGRRKEETLGNAHARRDYQLFKDDKKRIAIVSPKGLTGYDFHSSRKFKNQRQRVHYPIQMGWSAESALQGLGRTHRTGQVIAPFIKLVSTNVPGHRRFISTIARRLEQVGALSMGQRDAANTGVYSSADNMESAEANAALTALFHDIHHGRVLGWDSKKLLEKTGLQITDNKGSLLATMPTMKDFLNNLLATRLEDQHFLMNEFVQRWDAQIQLAIANGTLDTGTEIYKEGDSIRKVSEKEVWTDKNTGAKTTFIELEVGNRNEPVDFEKKLLDGKRFFLYNEKSKQVWQAYEGPTRDLNQSGVPVPTYRLFGPLAHQHQLIERATIDTPSKLKGWKKIDRKEAKELWTKAQNEAPEFRYHKVYVMSGVMLPIYNRIRGFPKVYRFLTDDGEQFLGRVIPRNSLNDTLRNLGLGPVQHKMSPQEAFEGLMSGEIVSIRLDNDWTFHRRRVSGEYRIEVTGVPGSQYPEFQSMGGFREMVGFSERTFVPVDAETGREAMGNMFEGRTIVEVRWKGGSEPMKSGKFFGGSVSVASWGYEPPETKRGKRLMQKLEKDANRADAGAPARVGLRSIFQFLADATHTLILEGKTQLRGHPGQFEPFYNIIRTKSATWQVMAHESGHALANYLRDIDIRLFTSIKEDLVALTQMEDSMASRETSEEGIAELVRRYITDPNSLPGDLIQKFEGLLNSIKEGEKLLKVLRDAHRAYVYHRSRPVEQQMAALRNDQPTKKLGQSFKDKVYWGLFNVFGGDVVVLRTQRKVWKWLTQTEDAQKTAKEIRRFARAFMEDLKDSPADFESAYQSLIHIPDGVSRALYGVGKGPEGIRVLADDKGFWWGSEKMVKDRLNDLRRLGFKIPSQRAKHGEWIHLYDKSISAIKHEITKKGQGLWELFQNYGQYRAALHRYETKGHEYPGMYDGLDPETVRQFLRETELQHPEFEKHFDEIQQYMNQLLLLPYLSGEISYKELENIVNAWEDYWPLPRQVFGRPTSGGRYTNGPHSGIFRAFGSQDTFRDLEEALEYRTRKAFDAYYRNRLAKTFVRLTLKLNNPKLPYSARSEALQLMAPLMPDVKVAAILDAAEEAKIIADYLNNEKKKQLPPGAKLEDKIKPDQIEITTPARKIWRATDPKAIQVIKVHEGGKPHYYQVTDPLLFDLLSKMPNPQTWLDTVARIGYNITAPWKRIFVQNLPFAVVNALARDPIGALFMGEGKRSLILGYYVGYALLNRFLYNLGRVLNRPMGANLDVISQSELYSKALDHTSRDAHRTIVEGFIEMLKEGISVPNYNQMTIGEKFLELPGQISATVVKPVDVLNYFTGGRWLSQTSEKLAREGAYLEALRKGYSPERAQLHYDQITGNFGQRQPNETVAMLVRTMGFLNPSLQFMWGIGKRFAHPDPQVRHFYMLKIPALTVIGGIGALMNLALIYGRYKDDEDELNEILTNLRERPDEYRFRFFSFMGRIQLPFDFGILGASASFGWNMVERYLLDEFEKNPKDIGEVIRHALIHAQNLPGITDVLQPHLKLGMELGLNHNFYFDDAIVPEWLEVLYPNNPELQTFTTIPDIYNDLGKAIRVSPIKIRYFMRGVFGRQMDEVITAINRGSIPEGRDIPVIGRLIMREPRGFYSKSVRSIVEAEDKLNGLRNQLKHEGDPQKRRQLREAIAELTFTHEIYKEIDRIYETVRIERDRQKPNRELIRQAEREMTRIAKAYRDFQQGHISVQKLEPYLSDRFWGSLLWEASNEAKDDLQDPERRRDSIEAARSILRRFRFSEDKMKELLRQEYARRYNRPVSRIPLYRNGRLTEGFGERFMRLKQNS